MTIKTRIRAGGVNMQHNEALRVRSTVKAGGAPAQHNETLRVRSMVKAGGNPTQHNEGLRTTAPAIAMLRRPRTTGRKEDRLELLVVRAGLRAGYARLRDRGPSR